MSRDVITVGSTMRIPLLYRGEYSQLRARFMNYLEEQTDGEAMVNSIRNGDQPLHVIAQVSLAGNAQNALPTLKDLKFWTAEEKKTQKIDRLARSLLIQGLPNDIYSLIYSNKTAKHLWDALERQMRGSEYGEQDRKAAILYEYETFKANEGEKLLDTYLRYLQVINDLKKCGYKKDNCDVNDALGYKKKAIVITSDPLALKINALLEKVFNRGKFYSKLTNNNLRTSSTSQSANKKQEFVKTDNTKEDKKANEKKRDMSKVKCYNYKKEGHFTKDCKKAKVKDHNYYKTKTLLAKKDSDEQVLSESDESSSSAEETIVEVAYYTSESESEPKFETSEYYDNSTNYGLFVNSDDDQEIFHDAIEFASENFIENHIDSQKDYDKSEVDHNGSKEKEHLVDKTPKQNGVVERRNRTLVKAARTMLTFANLPSFIWSEAIATACFTQNRSIIHKCFDKTPYELMNKRKPNIKFFRVFGCRCYLFNDYEDVGKLKAKGDIVVFVRYSKESAAFRIYNKRTCKIRESMNVNFDEILEMASKQFSLEPGLSKLNKTGKSSKQSVSQVSEASKKDLEDLFQDFYDEYFDSSKIMKSSTTNVETSINEEVFHEVSESFQGESFSSLLNDVSTSHNVFNERLDNAYFDASTSFHDPSNVHTFYQPYPHEKKSTKDHPLHKIIGDQKSSVRTRGQLTNSCLFSCLLSSIEPTNVAEALKVVDWVSAMQEELDQFAKLKV
uniref:Integrase catalytic domain-containing protein n=1 Tax=Tanacetum cinerariifolium TaxID=118510 RepID=A0A6L2JYY7_TANCI|nr:hypothetical protein [Tanacetum cinerariifolium]